MPAIMNNDEQKLDAKKTSVESTVDELRSRLEVLERETLKIGEKKQKLFARRFPLLYAFCAFVGLLFVWYGFWTLISTIPILGNPYVSSILGIVILIILGQFYNNMI